MTECERIITEGILPESFFRPETICDFYVDELRKRIWAIGIDLLIQFDRVCRKHNLKYFLSFGSLLGAIRHQGFIPWDDDIDVCMPREDYEKLKNLKSEFVSPYYLQFPGCDQDYYFSFAKLRNSNTSGISSAFRYANFNQGIWMDIFPMDKCDLTTLETNAIKINRLIAENSAWMRLGNKYLNESETEKLSSYKGRNPKVVLDEIESISREYEKEDKELITCATCTVYTPQKMTYRLIDTKEIITTSFYGYQVPIPQCYDIILEKSYGDYMKFPPADQRGTWHNTSYFNPNIPYFEALELLHLKDIKAI